MSIYTHSMLCLLSLFSSYFISFSELNMGRYLYFSLHLSFLFSLLQYLSPLVQATSALDAASERIVQQSIDELQASKAQTTIIIAHRYVHWGRKPPPLSPLPYFLSSSFQRFP